MSNRTFLVSEGLLLITFHIRFLVLSFRVFLFLPLSLRFLSLHSFSLSSLFSLLYFFLIFGLEIEGNPRTIRGRRQQQGLYDGGRGATIGYLDTAAKHTRF